MQLLDDNELFTIIEKPAGGSVHPSPGDTCPNLVDLLNIQIQKKLGVVTRLDRQAK
jgi:23S rRNA-/tRNA-specific pseudouridylate synthase